MDIMLEKIRILMAKERLSTKALSEKTEIKYNTLRDFMNGKTSKVDVAKIQAIAKALNCDIEYLTNNDVTEFIPYSPEEKKLYYLNEETAAYAQEIAKNKDLKLLFDASKNIRKEDMKLVYEMIKNFKSNT